jgi:hypothetical protein
MDGRDRRRREFVQSKPSSIDRNGAHRRHIGQGRCNRKTSVSPQTTFEVKIRGGRSSLHCHVQTRVSERLLSQLVAGDIRDLRKYPTYPVAYGLKDIAGKPIKGKFYEQKIQKVVKTDNVDEIKKVLKTRKRGEKSNI